LLLLGLLCSTRSIALLEFAIRIYGSSTGRGPIHVSKITVGKETVMETGTISYGVILLYSKQVYRHVITSYYARVVATALADIPCLVGHCPRGNDHDFTVLGVRVGRGGGSVSKHQTFVPFLRFSTRVLEQKATSACQSTATASCQILIHSTLYCF